MLPIVNSGMLYLVSAIEIIAALLIGVASLQCAVIVAGLFFRRSASNADKEDVRLQFGLELSLAIEFELAANIAHYNCAKLGGNRETCRHCSITNRT